MSYAQSSNNSINVRVGEFIKYLCFATGGSILVYFLLRLFMPIGEHSLLLWWSIGCFILLSTMAFITAGLAAKNAGGSTFIGLVMINVFFKLAASFIIVALYVKQVAPEDKFFIIPFLSTYLIFTVFETYFLNLQARATK